MVTATRTSSILALVHNSNFEEGGNMIPSFMRKRGIRAGLFLLVFSFMTATPSMAQTIDKVQVNIGVTNGEITPMVAKRITASIEAIGQRIFIGKDDTLIQGNKTQYDKVLGDIINRVVVGYVVSDVSTSYGENTFINVTLTPIGEMIQSVDTVIDYGSLTPEARRYVEKDLAPVSSLMSRLLVGLPVDSVGWAESVSQSAGRDFLTQILPEFQANIEVESGVNTKVRIYLIPKGKIVRTGKVSFVQTTVPRLLMLRAVTETESELRRLQGLPVDFVIRHRDSITADLDSILKEDSFIKKYQIETVTNLIPGETTELTISALTDHWLIQTEAWLDTGRDGNKNAAFSGVLGHFVGKDNLIFAEARVYPGPMDWNVYGGFMHRFGNAFYLGYKYDFIDQDNHVLAKIPFNNKLSLRFDKNFQKKENEFGLSYKIHNYMTVEYVYNDEEGKWLRLIANL